MSGESTKFHIDRFSIEIVGELSGGEFPSSLLFPTNEEDDGDDQSDTDEDDQKNEIPR